MIRSILKLLGGVLVLFGAFRGREPGPRVREVVHVKTSWKTWAVRGGLILAALGIGGFLVAASGIVPIKASSGHWAITQWFLDFSKKRSVSTHSLMLKAPTNLNADWRVLKGAGHFETGCRPCHGAPDMPVPRVPFAMTPAPPRLSEAVADFDEAGLFYIVKHGIKFTGMPAWPSEHRDDEIWSMVAFLKELPELDGPAYRRLARGEAPDSAKQSPLEEMLPESRPVSDLIRQNCARCHGLDGNGRGSGAFPKLAGQKPEYLFESLLAYATGQRHSGVMQPIAAALEQDVMRTLAGFYSKLPPSSSLSFATDQAAFERGREIALNGVPGKLVPACADCHLSENPPRNAHFPKLAGQSPEYLLEQLEIFKAGHRGGTAYAHLMKHAARNLTSKQIEDLAVFFSRLPSEPESRVKAK